MSIILTLTMEGTPLSAADQAEIDKRLNYMEAKDIAMFVIVCSFHDVAPQIMLLKCVFVNVYIVSSQKT